MVIVNHLPDDCDEEKHVAAAVVVVEILDPMLSMLMTKMQLMMIHLIAVLMLTMLDHDRFYSKHDSVGAN